MKRTVKLGRKFTGIPVAHHWAIQVGDTWFEIEGNSDDGRNMINRRHGFAAESGAGNLGGELLGKTTKSDHEIDAFIECWLARNPTHDVQGYDSQKFAYEFVVFLTDGNFRLPHRLDAAVDANLPHPKASVVKPKDFSPDLDPSWIRVIRSLRIRVRQ